MASRLVIAVRAHVGALTLAGTAAFVGCNGLLGDFDISPDVSTDGGTGDTGADVRLVDAAKDSPVASDAPANGDATDAQVEVGPVDASEEAEAGCVAPAVACNGACVDTTSDPNNCRACGVRCPVSATCVASVCKCSGTLTLCNGACVDTTSDSNNCRTCGTACLGGSVCSASTCKCAGALSYCTNACVNESNDNNHCGSCAKVCPGGSSCTNGACVVRYGFFTPLAGSSTDQPQFIFATKIDVPATVTVTHLGAIVKGGGPLMVLGLYSSNGALPGSLVVAAPQVTMAVGAMEIAVSPTTVGPGTYFVAADTNAVGMFGYDGATGAYIATSYAYNGVAPNPWPGANAGGTGQLNYYLVGTQ